MVATATSGYLSASSTGVKPGFLSFQRRGCCWKRLKALHMCPGQEVLSTLPRPEMFYEAEFKVPLFFPCGLEWFLSGRTWRWGKEAEKHLATHCEHKEQGSAPEVTIRSGPADPSVCLVHLFLGRTPTPSPCIKTLTAKAMCDLSGSPTPTFTRRAGDLALECKIQ